MAKQRWRDLDFLLQGHPVPKPTALFSERASHVGSLLTMPRRPRIQENER